MHQLRNYGDSRQIEGCAICGGEVATRDHVPPRVFLDEPFPENLPVVGACELCNSGTSIDEEYVACCIDCAVTGSLNSSAALRPKIGRILARKPALRARILGGMTRNQGTVIWNVEMRRVQRVIRKIACGLTVYELNEARHESPSAAVATPLASLDALQRAEFERVSPASVWPEVGSRAMQRLVVDQGGPAGWIVVQPHRFRYAMLWEHDATVVRMVFGEYLAAEVIWMRE